MNSLKIKMLMVAAALLLLSATGLFRFWQHVGDWLAVSDEPSPANVIVCLAGAYRIAKAADLFQQGYADTILLTVETTANALLAYGVPAEQVYTAPHVRTTFEEALAARAFVQAAAPEVVMVVSDPFHMARVRWSFTTLFADLPTRLVFVASDMAWPADRWFTNRHTRYLVASEVSKLIFYRVYHGWLGRELTPEWIWEWKEWYLALLRWVVE